MPAPPVANWLRPFALLISVVLVLALQGRRLARIPAAIAVACWTWLWGPLGLILASPLTVCLVVLGKYVPALRFFDRPGR